MVVFEFLGPATNHLNYTSSKPKGLRHRKTKLDPVNQFFMTLVKLRLGLTERYIGFWFGVSLSTVSRYFITWICLDWYPSTQQVEGKMPSVFREKYPLTQ